MKKVTNFAQYVEHRSVKIPFSGCIIWMGSTTCGGYGTSNAAKRLTGTTIVHKALFQHLNGVVPVGLYVCHHCDTPACVNPEHLFLGTPTENAQDRKRKNRSAKRTGAYNGRSRLTPEKVAEIRNLLSQGVMQKELVARYDVSQSTISHIKRRYTWGDLN
jgi:hypothetical protein